MNDFSEREKAFERKFEMDEELKFKTNAGAAHRFGLWAAEQLGLKDNDAESYAQQFVAAVTAKPGHAHLVAKAEKDLLAKGVNLSRHRIEVEYEACFQKTQQQLAS